MLQHTALFAQHTALGGKMVDFAGYALPVQYKEGVVQSHLHVRESAGLFDVSHMGQVELRGKDREAFAERVFVADVQALQPHNSAYSMMLNENGGIIDDCIVSKREDQIRVVLNAACKTEDMKHINEEIEASGMDVELVYRDDKSLVALQGPKAASVLARMLPANFDLPRLAFNADADVPIDGIDCTVSRCGYTGEDGFEISVANSEAPALFEKLIAHEEVQPSGLAVRDSLRLEAGLCLYGHDIDDTTSPIEAALNWTISKRRRAEGGFIGHEVVMKHLQKGGRVRKRVGLEIVKGPPAREGAEIVDENDEQVGIVTSGTFSPCLKKPIAMGYVKLGLSKLGTDLFVITRGRKNPARVTKMPFVPTNYHRVES